MSDQIPVSDEVFPKDSGKSYALVELMPGQGPMVDKGPENTVFSFPVVLLWEIILLLAVTLAIFLFSLVKQAPLDEIANPMVTTDPAKAPWYFVGLQELLEHMHPTLAGVVVPSVLVLFLLALPYIDYSQAQVGVWFSTQRGRKIAIWTALYTLIVMPAYIALDNAFSLRELLRDSAPSWVAQWLLPAGILLVLVLIPLLVLRRMKANRREFMLALFTVMLTSAVILTVSGFLFRGPGFKLYWPWEMPAGYNPWDEL
jgi:quinol-cytochrome oxidoreductase complex cytochrome b subunit